MRRNKQVADFSDEFYKVFFQVAVELLHHMDASFAVYIRSSNKSSQEENCTELRHNGGGESWKKSGPFLMDNLRVREGISLQFSKRGLQLRRWPCRKGFGGNKKFSVFS